MLAVNSTRLPAVLMLLVIGASKGMTVPLLSNIVPACGNMSPVAPHQSAGNAFGPGILIAGDDDDLTVSAYDESSFIS